MDSLLSFLKHAAPLMLALIAALLGTASSVVGYYVQRKAKLELERSKLELEKSKLIVEVAPDGKVTVKADKRSEAEKFAKTLMEYLGNVDVEEIAEGKK